MTINIVSNDERYFHLNKMLIKDGYESKICKIDDEIDAGVIILPIKKEHTDEELERFFSKISTEVLVLSPYGNSAINYAKSEELLKENAYLTAEGAISLYYNETKETLLNKKVVVLGYGRISKYLSRMLKNQGSQVYVYARREEIKSEILLDGYKSVELDEIGSLDPFAVFNTVPCEILKEKVNAYKFELASISGFKYKENVINGGGLPGRMFPKTAAEIIYKTIIRILTIEENV